MSLMKAAGLSAGYEKKVVVSGIDFTVSGGEILTLIGPTGAGKSTVLRTISAQLPAKAGKVELCGADISAMREGDISKKLALLLTGRLRTERMTCADVAETGRYPYTGRLGILSQEDKRIVREAMELTGVYHIRDEDITCVSDGQRQLVMLARAIAQQPQVLILDEQTSYLDISHKLKLLSLLRQLVRERGIAVVQSLHELDLAQKFSDRVLCISGGRAERIGTPEEVFTGEVIGGLYGIGEGSYNALYGTAEPPAVTGAPEVFVIGGGGSGIAVYRRLYRQGIPFAAGVLHENDIDLPAAQSLAAEVVTERAYEPIAPETIDKASEIMKRCGRVICCTEAFGTMNAGNRRLADLAKELGILENLST